MVDIVELHFEEPPPGVNNLYANIPGKGRVLSIKGKAWREHAGYQLNTQHPRHIAGPVSIDIAIEDKGKTDLDSHAKLAIDLLVGHGVIEDDNRAIVRNIRMYWDHGVKGCRVRVSAAEHPQ